MIRAVCAITLAVLFPHLASAQEPAASGTLRAVFLAQNPVQAVTDPASGEARGPAADLARELARRLVKPFTIKGVSGTQAVMDAVKSGDADIGFLAYDEVRAAEVDFSQTYALAQNTYMVLGASQLRRGSDVDKPGVKVGVAERDAGDFFLTRTLKQATILRNPGGDLGVALRKLEAGEIDVYAANRQRLSKFAEANPGVRLFPDNFYGVEQAVIVRKGNTAALTQIDRMIDELRTSGAIDKSIERAGLVGVDVAPPPSGPR
jgi:polar amino acid transport system substrate-binding protein